MEKLKEIRDLEKQIDYHSNLYYVKSKPIISDVEFDKLWKKLEKLEKDYPELKNPNSPTTRVGSDLSNDFVKENHIYPALSLEKAYDEKEINKFLDKADDEYIIEWKSDGASLVLYYEFGILVKAISRGNGYIGDNVTENARTIKNIPLVLSKPINLFVRGEVYMTQLDFDKFNKNNPEEDYKNPRNLASGSLKNKHSKETAKRPLRFIAYDTIGNFKSDEEGLIELTKLGFEVIEWEKVKKKDVMSKLLSWKTRYDKLPYAIDGLVVKYNKYSIREELGTTSNGSKPEWGIAFKWAGDTAESEIINIELGVGRTGKITPRAQITPTEINGSTVSYVTLNNSDFIEEKEIGIRSKILFSKRGEIIPAVEECLNPGEVSIFKFPKNCPCCKSLLSKQRGNSLENGVHYYCNNMNCSERVIESIIYFCAKKQMDITDFSGETIRKLYNLGYIKILSDIYVLHKHKSQLEELPGFGKRKVEIILKSIEESKKQSFTNVLVSLGLEGLGHSTCKMLIQEYGFTDIEKFLNAQSNDFVNIPNIGDKTAVSIVEQFKNGQGEIIDLGTFLVEG